MSNSKYSRILLAGLFLLTIVVDSLALAQTGVPPEIVAELKKWGPGSGVETQQLNQDGMVTYTTTITLCSHSGLTCRSRTNSFRTTQSQISIDGKVLRVETVDRKNGDYDIAKQKQNALYERLSFKSSSVSTTGKQDAQGFEQLDMSNRVDLEVNPYTPMYNEIAAVLPSVAVGIANGLEDLKASTAASERLQKAYQDVLTKVRGANDQLVGNAQAATESGQVSSGYISASAAESMGQPVQSSSPAQAYAEYLKAARDPLAFHEYEMTPLTRQNFLKTAEVATQYRLPEQAIQHAEKLLYQKDPALRAEAAKRLTGFRDGVLKTQAFGARQPSLIDQTRFKSKPQSLGGQVVRRMANKAQTAWLSTNGFEQASKSKVASYLGATSALRAADDSFAAGRTEEGLYLAGVAGNLLDFSIGALRGLGQGLMDQAKSFSQLAFALGKFALLAARNEEAALMQLGSVIKEIPGMVEAMTTHYLKMGDKIFNGSPDERGYAVGQLSSDLLFNIITEGAAAGVKSIASGGAKVSVGAHIAEVAITASASTLDRALAVATKFPRGARESYLNLAKQGSESALKIMSATEKLTLEGASGAAEYLNISLRGAGKAVLSLTDGIESGVIRSAGHVKIAEKFLPALEKMPHQIDFRLMGSTDKVILIGRDMEGNVLKIKEQLRREGIVVETFSVDGLANDEWIKLVKKYKSESQIPEFEILNSAGYKANRSWLQEKIDSGYTILDANNPNKKPHSIYYDGLELEMLREANKR